MLQDKKFERHGSLIFEVNFYVPSIVPVGIKKSRKMAFSAEEEERRGGREEPGTTPSRLEGVGLFRFLF
jgi:hypothetical protein